MTDKQEVQVWTPTPFVGTDLLPTSLGANAVDRTGREHVESGDLVLPSMSVLQGMSEAVTKGTVEGARPGKFFHSGCQEVLDGPIRVLLCAHTRSRALFVQPDRAEHKGLESCMSRDGIDGTVYGHCDSCPHKEWGKNNVPPPCSESHNFTALTKFGPAVIRFARTSFKAARNFLTTWTMSPRPLWAHPAIITVNQQSRRLATGKDATYYSMDIRWAQREDVPAPAQSAARAIWLQVNDAHEAGKFSTDAPDGE